MKLNLKSKILLIGLGSLLLFLVIIAFSNTAELQGKIGKFKTGDPCNDGNKCTVNDVIQPNGKCTGTQKPPPATRPNSCKEFVCRTATGKFSEISKIDGTTCDDQNPYTSNDKCSKGTCKSTGTILSPISLLCDPDGDGKITDKFKDDNLLAAIKNALGKEPTDDITLQDALKITFLKIDSEGIKDISGIECFTKLTTLYLSDNPIKDISPISGLKNLKSLSLANIIGNIPSDFEKDILNLSPLSGMTNLEFLHLALNSISDIKALAGLTKLTELHLDFNKIWNITPLSNLKNLQILGISDNKISNINAISGMTNLTELNADNNNYISDIAPLTNMTKLTWLSIHNNLISDITFLSGLTKLSYLRLDNNQIFVIEALVDLTELTWLNLNSNYISDIASLINNIGLGAGDNVFLGNNTKIPADQIEGLKAKGVMVDGP